jgi:hypothetical protein
MKSNEPMIKGAAIREFFTWYQKTHGIESVRVLVRHAPPDLRPLLDPEEPMVKLLPATWYPCRLVHPMLDAVKERMSDAAFNQMAKEANRHLVRTGMNSVYRFFLEKLVSPELYATLVPRFWRQLHTTGVREMTIVRNDDGDGDERAGVGEAISITRDWGGHHPLLCTCVIETMCAIFEQMGKKDVKWVRETCVGSGAAECRTRLTWKS